MGASSFKNQIESDIGAVFLHDREFAEEHMVDGEPMIVMIDDNELLERDKRRINVNTDGVYRTRRMLYVAEAVFGPRPAIGRALNLDGRHYRVRDVSQEMGVFGIELEAVKT